MPAIAQTWPRYSSILSRCSAMSIGSSNSTCFVEIMNAILCSPPSIAPFPLIQPLFAEGKCAGEADVRSGGVWRDVCVVARVDDRGERRDEFSFTQPHHDHA